MRIKANGISFNCEIEGPADAPWLAFSNSLATNLSMWDPQAADLKHSFRLLRYDQRGHGGTDAPAGRYTYATLVADALALFDALELRPRKGPSPHPSPRKRGEGAACGRITKDYSAPKEEAVCGLNAATPSAPADCQSRRCKDCSRCGSRWR